MTMENCVPTAQGQQIHVPKGAGNKESMRNEKCAEPLGFKAGRGLLLGAEAAGSGGREHTQVRHEAGMLLQQITLRPFHSSRTGTKFIFLIM